MPLEERRQRHAATFKVLVRNDLSHWAERFLRTLDHPPGSADTLPLARAAGRR
jgi:trehalose-6-phosphate synthase